MNKQDIFFNGMMSLGVASLIVGVIGNFEILVVVSSGFIFVAWICVMAIRRNDVSRKQLEELKRKLEALQNPNGGADPASDAPQTPDAAPDSDDPA